MTFTINFGFFTQYLKYLKQNQYAYNRHTPAMSGNWTRQSSHFDLYTGTHAQVGVSLPGIPTTHFSFCEFSRGAW